ncbi:phospholipase D family protein [Streptantibioticus ferralitis]|uniref:Phospholipase D family protein n=1 Tax=Streptantibioticus ferralitis TaxID=236510 RepID=A0ABT5YRV9_9ACTN|nr:phospholipase D family protein [Streptantibioticus ferralitis]MDF2254321.1 phospholipase D family protein [Streptantibioticus ferralitis]
MRDDHVWQQIQQLLHTAHQRVVLITPFIKKGVFQAALDAIPDNVTDINCVTRWSVAEIVAGVSDPEIVDLAIADGRAQVRLCHNLHAKLYAADTRCLVGSANLTGRATGLVLEPNLEVLVETETTHPEVQRVLDAIDHSSVPATLDLARQLREQAELIQSDEETPRIMIPGQQTRSARWLPETRRPERLYRVYCGRHRNIGRDVLAGVLRDLAELDIAPGLPEEEFAAAVRVRLHELPELRKLSDAGRLNLEEAREELVASGARTLEQAQRAVETIAEWLRYFDEVHFVPTGPWEIRQGKRIV